MLYLIGGAARSGKTILARRLLNKKSIPYFCIDYFVSSMDRGMPEIDISHDDPVKECAYKLWPRLEPMLRNIIEVEPDYIVEGDRLLPEFVGKTSSDYPNQVVSCFLGYPAISLDQKKQEIEKNTNTVNNWTEHLSDSDLLKLIGETIEYSKFLQDECRKFNIPYFDVSDDFSKAIENAFHFLLEF